MIQTYANLLRRYADARPGLKLMAVEQAALPVSVLRTDVLVQVKRDLPAIDEFFLRFADDGVDSVESIAGYLGLPRELVIDSATRQVSAGHVERKGPDRFAVTQLGRAVVSDLVDSQPALKQISFVFDRLAWAPASYPQSSLLTRREALGAGLLLLPAAATAAITSRDVAISDLNRVMRGDRATALRVIRLAGRRHLWAPAQLLVFGDGASREVELALYIDDEIAQAHENALQEAKAVTRLQITAAPLAIVPTPRFEIVDDDGDANQADVLSIEHVDHLLHAAIHAKERLAVASQSARHEVVTEVLCRYLRERAREGVDVTLVINDAAQVDDITAARLQRLVASMPSIKVAYADLSGTSYLIYDDVVIETTFDWLGGGKNGREYSWNTGRLTRSKQHSDLLAAKLRRARPRDEA